MKPLFEKKTIAYDDYYKYKSTGSIKEITENNRTPTNDKFSIGLC